MADSVAVESVMLRAGFWRRAVAFLIDALIIALPMQVLVIVLFALTDGSVQSRFGIYGTVCNELPSLPIVPTMAPPPDYNSIVDCRVTLAGFDMARTLTVSRVTLEGGVTTRISHVYYLGADGKQRDVWSIDLLAYLVFFAYLVVLESRHGATLGKRLLSIRTTRSDDALAPGISVRSALLRYGVMFAALVPGILVTFGYSLAVGYGGGDPYALLSHPAFVGGNIVAGLIFFGWFAWIIVSVVRKRDPVYDRAAGTSVWKRP
ncbi:RDD family protein [Ensifer sp.]|jgi:uncharacterized RDD family membrane protein YckC|uniref:RDD family protein n=1 Tax=Ensifer sp. TaxID=1872086 RepID=UPI002E0DC6D8|nr:RDD family protein [Ensifer sp.]